MIYPFVAAGAPDYGGRKGPALGLLYHMAEGGNTVAYLSHAGVPRGVSVHAVCEYSGRVVQMLHWDRASGSLNPRDTSTDKAYYGQKHLMDVLGSWWGDPNSAVLSMEIEGFAAKGPNPAQVDGAVAWGEDMKGLFSALRGALGHADQTDTKGCPGTSLAMRLVFEGVGGHGLWHPQSGPQQPPVPEEPMGLTITAIKPAAGVVTVNGAGHSAIRVGDGVFVPLAAGTVKQAIYTGVLAAVPGHPGIAGPVFGVGDTEAVVLASDVTFAAAPTPNCDAAVNAALDHVAPSAAATVAAIAEARPR